MEDRTLDDDTAGLALRGRARPWETFVGAIRREEGSKGVTTGAGAGAAAGAAAAAAARNGVAESVVSLATRKGENREAGGNLGGGEVSCDLCCRNIFPT